MMEVKHSPATQMEFRSNRNGLSDNVEEDLETLFEEDSAKPVIPKADKCDEKLPILNGVSKCGEKSDPIKNLDDIDIDLDSQKDEHDETAAEKEDSEEVYDLDLESESTGDTQNGETADSSKVRDTGDDLDTLLSKINDLVEDCMDEPKVSVPKATVEDVVEIGDDDLDDVVKDEVASEVKRSVEESETPKDTKVNVKKQENTDKEDSVKDSKDSTSDKMDVDDFVFCLDSPIDESRSQGEEIPEVEEVSETAEEEVKIQKKEETKVSTVPTVKETVQSKPSEEDDDVFLIEDDEDEDALMETESAGIEDEDLNKEIEEVQRKSKKELEKEAEKDCKEIAGDKSRDGAKVEVDASETMNEEDDDIVCLDDSNEALEEKDGEPPEEKSASKTVDAATESRKEKAEQEAEKPSVNVEETAADEAAKEIVKEEAATKAVDMEVEEEQTVDTVSDADDTHAPVMGCADLAKEAKEEQTVLNPEKSSDVTEDDDVVILDDDDEQTEAIPPVTSTTPEKPIDQPSTSDSCGVMEEAKASKDEKATDEEATSDKGCIVESSTIISDNSDNARDGVDEKEDNDVAKQTPKETSVSAESNSCSASEDSLLKESKKVIRAEAEENNEQPPTKKLRLSQDESNSRLSIISHEESKSNTPDTPDNDEVMDDSKPLKRVRSTDSIPTDFKKPKTETEPDKVDDNNSKDSKDIIESKDDICKAGVKHLPLYPPPKLEPPTIDLSLDFLKRFKKTIHKMTKSDLEELVLQKIVEAIVHKSEFSEMRDLIEKQDKIIAGHRTKITELNKQFRDLEMVHNRVLKDLETKNAQFVMPVKITRAVGLQVFFPAKKYDPTLMPLAPQNTAPVPPPHTPRSLLNNSAHSADRSSHSSPVAVSTNTPKSSTSTSSQAASSSSSSVQQQAPPQRRGCVQKLTPLRPDTPRNSPLNRSISAGVVSSSTPSPSTSKEYTSKFAPRPVGPKTRVTPVSAGVNVSLKVPLVMPPNDPVPPEQPKKFKTVAIQPHKPSMKAAPKRYPQHGNSDPQSVAQPLPAAALIVAPAIPPAVASTVASKSAQKSVIDLTDEDDVLPSAPAPSSKVPAAPAAQVSTTPQASAASSGSRPYKVSVVPQQQLQQPKPNPPKQTPQRAIAPAPPKPNGVANRQLSAAPSRYRHPAPLPNQPIHNSNPAWKLPPARPTIRISNLESGIVISWTIEDTTKDKYAESTSYQIYAYQETSGPPLVESWRHVGDVKAMLLPMAVTLTQFQEGQRYYFAVRAVDAHNRCGPFSFAKTWS